MVVTLGATQRRAQPHGRGRIYAVHDVFGCVFIRVGAAFKVDHAVPIEPARDLLLDRSARQHVSGELLDRKLIKRHVAVERVDHPLPPLPHVTMIINVIAVGIRITRQIQPELRHALAKSG